MKSRRSWLIGLALGAALSFGAPAAHAQGPRLFSYQGLMLDGTKHPVADGAHTVLVEIYDASANGALVYQEQQTPQFTGGVFDLIIGSQEATTHQLPLSVDFTKPYWLQITYEPGGTNEQKFPRQQILSVPYALSAERANGIPVSSAPVSGNIFPIPMVNGKVDPNFLPPSPASVQKLNSVGPDNNGAISVIGAGGITVADDVTNHTLTISGASAAAPDTIAVGPGLVGGGIIPDPVTGSRMVTVGIGNGAITNNMFGPGAISGSKISQIAGLGLLQNNAGLLDVNTDNATLTIQNNMVMIAPGGVGTLQIANGAVNLANPNQKVNGILPVANGGTGDPSLTANALLMGNGTNPVALIPVGANGTVLTSNGTTPNYAALTTNVSLQGNGTTAPFGINLGNSNIFTAAQTFPNINLTNTTNQINFGTGTTTTLTVPTPAAARTITLPDVGTNASVILNNSTSGQSIGSTAAGSSLTINSNGSLATNAALTINGTETHTGATTQTGTLNLAGAASPIQLNSVGGGLGQIIASNGAAVTPTWIGPGTATTVLHGNAAGLPTYGAVALGTDVSGVLPIANGGTNASTLGAAGSVAYSTGTAYGFSAVGTSGQVLLSNGAGTPTWGSLTFDKITNGTNVGNALLQVGNGSVLSPVGTGIINANQLNGVSLGSMTATNGNILVANGTTWNSVPMTGDASIASTGAITLANTAQARTDIGLGAANTPTFAGLTLTSPLTVGNGGTGVNTFAAGVLHSSGGTAALTSGQVNLTTEVTGILPTGNGGTGIATPTNGSILYGSGANPMNALSIGAANNILVSTGSAPSWNTGATLFIMNQNAVQQAGTFNINGTATIGGATSTGALTVNGNLTQVIGGQQGIQTHLNTATRTYTWPDKSGTVAMLSDLATNVGASAAADRMLRGNGLGGWVDAGPNALLSSTGNLSVLGGSGITVSGGGNISTSTGILITGSNALAGRVQLGDGSTNNTGTITVTQPFTANQSYNLPNYTGTFILDNSPNGQSITNANAANASLNINSAGSLTTNPALVVKGTTSMNGALNMNASAISNASTITASGLINGGSFQNTGNSFNVSGAGAVGASSVTASGLINGGSFQNTANSFNVTGAGAITGTSLNAGSGTIQTTGNTSTGSLTVTTGGANITGGITMTGTGPLTATGSAGTLGQVLISNGGAAAPSWSSTPAIFVPFTNITSGTNTGQALVVGNGSTLTASGTGVIAANQFVGTGSTTTAVDLATAEVAGVLPVANGGTNASSFTANTMIVANAGATALASLANGGANTVLHGTTPPTYSGVATGDILNSNVTYNKLQNESASTLLGNPTGLSAAPSEITLGSGLGFAGTTLANTGVLSFAGGTTGLTPAGATTGAVTLGGILNPANGGTGLNGSAAANGNLLIGNGTGYTLAPITGTAGQIGVTNGAGSITLTNLGVLSFSGGTTGLTPNVASTGAVTLGGTLNVTNGGTGQTTFTTGSILLGNGASSLNSLADVAAGSVLTSGGVGTNPTWGSGSSLFIQNQFASAQTPASFWIGGQGRIDANAAGPALQLSNAGAGPALSVTQGSSALLNTGVTGTLSSTGSTTLGTTGVTVNTLGNTTAGTTNTISGNTTFDGTNQTTADLVKIQNVPNVAASWGERITATTPGGNNAQGIIAVATSASGSSNAANFQALGGGAANTALSLTATGASSTNTGASISVSGTGRVGVNINANGAGTGVVINNAAVGVNVPGVGGTLPTTATAYNAKLGATGGQTGFAVDMSTGLSGDAGVSVNNVGGGTGMNISSISTGGSGINITGVTAGVGVSVQGATGGGSNITSSVTGSGTGIKTTGDGSTATTALEVSNGQVKATGVNKFADTYTLTGANQLATSFSISNGLVATTSTIIMTALSNGGTVGVMTVSGVGAGSFTVTTTAADFTGVTAIYYEIINH